MFVLFFDWLRHLASVEGAAMLKSCRILGTEQWTIFGTHATFVCLRCRCCDVKRGTAMLLEESFGADGEGGIYCNWGSD